MLQIKDLFKNRTTVPSIEIEFRDGIFVSLNFVSRGQMQSLAKTCTIQKYEGPQRGRVAEVNSKKFASEFSKLAVVGWKGLTPRSLITLVPGIDVSGMSKEQLDEEIPFSHEQLDLLVTEAWELDQFIQNMAVDPKTFAPNLEQELGNLPSSQNGSSTESIPPAKSA